MERRIVVGVDPTREHDAALEFAVGQALRRRGTLHLVVVRHAGHHGRDRADEVRLVGDELVQVDQELFDRCVRRIEEWAPDLEVTTEVRRGPVAATLADVLARRRAPGAGPPPDEPSLSRPHALDHVTRRRGRQLSGVCRAGRLARAGPAPRAGRGRGRGPRRAGARSRNGPSRRPSSAGSSLRVVRAWYYVNLDTDEESLRHGTGAEEGAPAISPAVTSEGLADLVAAPPATWPCQVDNGARAGGVRARRGLAARTGSPGGARPGRRPAACPGLRTSVSCSQVRAQARLLPVAVVDSQRGGFTAATN